MAALLDVLSSSKSPSKAALLRAALPEIDEAMAAGYSHAEILNALNQRGLNMTFTVYQTTLYRIRKQPKKDKTHAPKATAQAQTIAAQDPPQTNTSGKKSFVFNKTPAKNLWK